jgi:hypothetical protein
MTNSRDLKGVRFEHVDLHDALFADVDFDGLRMRGVSMRNARLRGAELIDVEIDAELGRVVVNGVDIAPLVDAELNRRMPERAKMRPTDADGFREAWSVLERLWASTVERARTFPEERLHECVDGEWSFIETLRHLGFATAAWVERMVLGNPAPWHPWDLPWDEAPGWEGIPRDRQVRPTLSDMLTLRHRRQGIVRDTLAALTDEDLGTKVTRTEPGWPREENFPVRKALLIVLNEEWEHRLYAERDLSQLS